MQFPLQTVLTALTHADLIRTPFIPSTFRPSVFLQVEFPSGASVQLGNNIQPSEGAEEPLVSFTAEDPTVSGGSYTLVSFDPDAPSRVDQHFGSWRHLIRGGLKPKSLDEIAVAGGGSLVERTEEPVTPWAGPSPGAGTGPHRYVFLLYKQTKPLRNLEEQTFKSNERIDRRNFDVPAFVAANGLELVGANYFLCENP